MPDGPATHAATGADAPGHGATAFRADIQGLRAIAVLSVVLFHAGRAFPSGGFAGVDIFFVISGYLITGILLGEMQRGQFSLTAFYERRVRRLFPALFTLLAAVLVLGLVLLPPSAMKDLARNTFSTIFFASNFDFFSHIGYFDADARNLPLLHTWSLAVEEQFYIVFPLLLFALYRFARRRLRTVLIVLAAVSLAACEWMVRHSAEAAFYLAPFRAFELLIGAVIAKLAVPARFSQCVRDAVSLLGLAAIAAGLFFLTEDNLFPSTLALIPCLGAAAILFAGAGGTSLGGRLISGPVFSYFGNLSYSLYLWHWPVLVFARFAMLREPTFAEATLLVALSVTLATLSWRFVERPFLKRRGNPWRAIGAGLALMAAGSSVAFALVRLQGAPQRFTPAALHLFQSAQDFSPDRLRCHNLLGALRAYAQNCVLGAAAEPHVAVWGDSYGVELAEALAERLGAQGRSLIEVTASSCPPAIGLSNPRSRLCDAQNLINDSAVLTDRRIQTIVFAAHFGGYGDAEPLVLESFTRAVRAAAHAGKHVVLIDAMPIAPFDAPSALGLLQQRAQPLTPYGEPRAAFEHDAAAESRALGVLAGETHADMVHPAEFLCDTTRCHAFAPRRGVLYFNRDHLSMTGARLLAERVPLS